MPSNTNPPDSLSAIQKIEEAKAVLRDLGLPLAQQNEQEYDSSIHSV
ncbi:MAG: hypothetical protein PUP93_24075 [Rhizonema sp. NSF051]|nr:hypothetical protein [Rhizonema sp. NSF051]